MTPAFYLYSEVPHVTKQDLQRMAAAGMIQMSRDVCPRYGLTSPSMTVVDKESDVPGGPDVVRVPFQAKLSLPDAAAFHSVDKTGRPFAPILASPDLTLDYIQDSFSHEAVETRIDWDAGQWELQYATDAQPERLLAREACDPVEGTFYLIDLGDGEKPVRVSNFVTPEWFMNEPPPGAQFDYLGRCTAPWELLPSDGAYAVAIIAGNIVTLPQGKELPQKKFAPHSRLWLRIARGTHGTTALPV